MWESLGVGGAQREVCRQSNNEEKRLTAQAMTSEYVGGAMDRLVR